MKNINETRNYFIEEINQNDFMNKKCKKVCTAIKYIKHFLILASAFTGCISISPPELKSYATTAGVKKSIIKKKEKKHNLKSIASKN